MSDPASHTRADSRGVRAASTATIVIPVGVHFRLLLEGAATAAAAAAVSGVVSGWVGSTRVMNVDFESNAFRGVGKAPRRRGDQNAAEELG